MVRSVRPEPRVNTFTSAARMTKGSTPPFAGAQHRATSQASVTADTLRVPPGGAYTESPGPSKTVDRPPSAGHSSAPYEKSARPDSMTAHTSWRGLVQSSGVLRVSPYTSKPTYSQAADLGVTESSWPSGR